jgi:hypothetical protein
VALAPGGGLDLDHRTRRHRLEPHERRTQQLAQLALARQPHHLAVLDAVQRPLDRAVEADHLAGREVVHLDGHVADHEHVVVHLPVRHDEPVPRDRLPLQPGVAQPLGHLQGDHGRHSARSYRRILP